MKKKIGFLIIIVILICVLGIFYFSKPTEKNGKHVEELLSYSHPMITVTDPMPNEKISSPLTIKGQAKGTWFFEASFPVVLVDWDGRIIAEGYAQTQGDWMTEDFVPFEATLTFEKPDYKDNGALILKRDNPSGLPENDDAFEFPVYFE